MPVQPSPEQVYAAALADLNETIDTVDSLINQLRRVVASIWRDRRDTVAVKWRLVQALPDGSAKEKLKNAAAELMRLTAAAARDQLLDANGKPREKFSALAQADQVTKEAFDGAAAAASAAAAKAREIAGGAWSLLSWIPWIIGGVVVVGGVVAVAYVVRASRAQQ